MMELDHRNANQPGFKCCEERITFFDSVSCDDLRESCIMICKKCKTKYFQEIILGRQYTKVGNANTSFPHYTTFTLPENLK